MDWLNFRHLYAFWMVARSESFTGAAAQMHVAQSAVSAQVSALETYVEEKLFVRGHRVVELTPAGRELLGYANKIFMTSRAINALVRDKEVLGYTPTLRIGIVGGVSRNFVYRLLERYQRNHPSACLSVSSGSYAELYGQLRRFEVESIVTLEPPKKRDMTEVRYQRLGDSKLCVAATPELIREVREGRVNGPLDVYKFRHPFEVDVLEQHVQPMIAARCVLRMDTDDIPLLRFFANSGTGVAVLPRIGIHEDLETGVVEAIDLADCPEVNVYGISMSQAHPVLRDAPSDIWSLSSSPE